MPLIHGVPCLTYRDMDSSLRRLPAARCEDIAGEVAPVRCATIGVLRAVADALRGEGRQAVVEATYLGTGRLSSLERPVLASAKYLLVCGRLGDVSSDIDSCWDDLAAVGDAGDAAALVTGHAKKLVESASAVRHQAIVRVLDVVRE